MARKLQTPSGAEVVALAYEAALEPARLPELAEAMARVAGAEASIWLESTGRSRQAAGMMQTGLSQAIMEQYACTAWSSPLVPALLKVAPEVAKTDRMLLDRRIFERSTFYQNWVRPLGLGEGLIVSFAPLQQESIAVTLLRDSRTRLNWTAGSPDFKRFCQVVPYIGRAAVLRTQLNMHAGATPAGAANAFRCAAHRCAGGGSSGPAALGE